MGGNQGVECDSLGLDHGGNLLHCVAHRVPVYRAEDRVTMATYSSNRCGSRSRKIHVPAKVGHA